MATAIPGPGLSMAFSPEMPIVTLFLVIAAD